MQKSTRMIRFILMAVPIIFLQGCMDVATTSAQVLYHRQGIQKQINDQYITMQAYKAINTDDPRFKNTNIAITTYHGDVLLAGQVPEPWQKKQIGAMLKRVPDINHIYNLVTVSSPSSALTRISDAWITAKVKTKLLASEDLDATQIKVVTENGTVYLMGILKPEEAESAVDIASNTDGVISVVKVFSYMKIYKA